MHKLKLQVLMLLLFSSPCAIADQQRFWGFGPGIELVSKDGSGAGFYAQALLGYVLNPTFSGGVHGGFSNVGNVGVQTFDFGVFLQLTDSGNGTYGRLYLDGIN